MNNSTLPGRFLLFSKIFQNRMIPFLILLVILLFAHIPKAGAWDFSPTDHFTAFNVDIGTKKASFKILILRDVSDTSDDDNLNYASFDINGTDHLTIYNKKDDPTGYGNATIFIETADQDEERWGIRLLSGVSNLNYVINALNGAQWLEVTFDLAESVYYDLEFHLNASKIVWDDENGTNISDVPGGSVDGWPEISLSGLSASNDNCSQVNLSWDASGYQTDMRYEVHCDGEKIASGQGQESYTHFLGEPEARGYNYTVEVGYGDNLASSKSANATGGPPRTGYNNVT